MLVSKSFKETWQWNLNQFNVDSYMQKNCQEHFDITVTAVKSFASAVDLICVSTATK